jgi:RNA polymerase sigma-70 factor (ECF subfamily)
LWLSPYPDELLEGIPDTTPGPDLQYERREAVSLAFVTALQLLPPRQRAVLILRDVLGYHAKEVAEMLNTTAEAVASAHKRARATVHARLPTADPTLQPLPPQSTAEYALTERFTTAFEAGDVDGVVALLTEDVSFTMPPLPFEWHGRDLASPFLTAMWQALPVRRLVATRANGQPAFVLYVPEPDARRWHALGLLVLTLHSARVSAITRFGDDVLPYFGLPPTIDGAT